MREFESWIGCVVSKVFFVVLEAIAFHYLLASALRIRTPGVCVLIGLRIGRMMQISCKVLPQPRFTFRGFCGLGICLAGVIRVVSSVFVLRLE